MTSSSRRYFVGDILSRPCLSYSAGNGEVPSFSGTQRRNESISIANPALQDSHRRDIQAFHRLSKYGA